MITLLLLHPLKQTPIQVWPFDNESVIRVGRSTDNDVVLYSAVVSRRHVELRKVGGNLWDIVNLGTNGTYVEGKRIEKVAVQDGTVIRLARSGPNIQIRLGADSLRDLPDHLIGHRPLSVKPQPTKITEMIDPLRRGDLEGEKTKHEGYKLRISF
ncbi:MAG: FHA domain-containing protein [Cyanobacteria bacterium P01_F01_bin.150]